MHRAGLGAALTAALIIGSTGVAAAAASRASLGETDAGLSAGTGRCAFTYSVDGTALCTHGPDPRRPAATSARTARRPTCA